MSKRFGRSRKRKLQAKIDVLRLRADSDARLIATLRQGYRESEARCGRAESELSQIVRAIEDIEPHSAVLGVKTVEGSYGSDEVHYAARPPRSTFLFDAESTESYQVTHKVLHRLIFEETTQAVVRDVIAFRVCHRGVKAEVSIPIAYYLNSGALELPRVREQMTLDMARGLVQRLVTK